MDAKTPRTSLPRFFQLYNFHLKQQLCAAIYNFTPSIRPQDAGSRHRLAFQNDKVRKREYKIL